MKKLLLITLTAITACSQPKFEITTTTESNPWSVTSIESNVSNSDATDIIIESTDTLQEIEGFGACFNELGWTSLQRLSPEDREGILQELFEPGFGANFTICRMPVAANDFARDWYSYNESEAILR